MQQYSSSKSGQIDPAFSPSGLDALRRLDLDGTGDVVPKVLRLFQTQLDRSILEVEAASTAADWRTLKKAAHGLKGASYNVGAQRLGDCCRQLETVGALALAQHLAARLAEFDAEVSRVRVELRLLLTAG